MLFFFQCSKFFVRHVVPQRWRYSIARALGYGVCFFNRSRRRIIVDNLTPLMGQERARRVAPVLMGNFLMTAVDFFCSKEDLAHSTVIENWSTLKETYRKTGRLIAVTAHMGHWELGISCLLDRGLPVSGVYARYTDDEIVEWILKHRNPEAEWIPTSPGAAMACVAAVENRRILGMVADIPFGEKGRRVQLAGHTTRLPIGPWVIAVRTQATIIPAFVIRESPGVYRGIIHPPIQPPEGQSYRRQIEMMQDQYCRILEHYLRTYPEQWGVLQPFWER